MGYYDYLCELLAPLRVYALERGSMSGSELYAAGAALDTAADALAHAERESILPLAQQEGLSAREKLFSRCPVNVSAALRRQAVAALTQIGADSFTPDAIGRTLIGCGIPAAVSETDTYGVLRVTFPGTVGEPDGFDQIQKIILDILPCHLLTEFFLRYLTWTECEQQNFTWAAVEGANHTWGSFMEAVEG